MQMVLVGGTPDLSAEVRGIDESGQVIAKTVTLDEATYMADNGEISNLGKELYFDRHADRVLCKGLNQYLEFLAEYGIEDMVYDITLTGHNQGTARVITKDNKVKTISLGELIQRALRRDTRGSYGVVAIAPIGPKPVFIDPDSKLSMHLVYNNYKASPLDKHGETYGLGSYTNNTQYSDQYCFVDTCMTAEYKSKIESFESRINIVGLTSRFNRLVDKRTYDPKVAWDIINFLDSCNIPDRFDDIIPINMDRILADVSRDLVDNVPLPLRLVLSILEKDHDAITNVKTYNMLVSLSGSIVTAYSDSDGYALSILNFKPGKIKDTRDAKLALALTYLNSPLSIILLDGYSTTDLHMTGPLRKASVGGIKPKDFEAFLSKYPCLYIPNRQGIAYISGQILSEQILRKLITYMRHSVQIVAVGDTRYMLNISTGALLRYKGTELYGAPILNGILEKIPYGVWVKDSNTRGRVIESLLLLNKDI